MSAAPRPASLAAVAVRRRAKAESRNDKDGDLTGRIAEAARARPSPEMSPMARVPDGEPPPRPEEIVVYWERLRRGRPFPSLTEIDRPLVGRGWPDSLIVAFDAEKLPMPRISRLGGASGAIDYTPMVTDWILTRARHAARRSAKLDEVQSFPLEGESARYRLLALPVGTAGGASGGVLCHLCRVP